MSHRTLAAFLVASVFSVCAPPAGAQGQCVSYQVDPRLEPFEIPENQVDWTIADALIVFSQHLTLQDDGTTYKMRVLPWTNITNFGPGCSNRDYHGQPGELAIGSGVLVGRDRILTQQHVMWVADNCTGVPLCDITSFVFGFGNYSQEWHATCDDPNDPSNCWVLVNASDVYTCKKQWDGCTNDPIGEWAVVQLDREVPDRTPLPIQRSDGPPPHLDLTVVGHPNRIPMKVESVQLLYSSPGEYGINGHLLFGNSGSMVIDDITGNVIGTVYGYNAFHTIALACDPPPDSSACYREDFVSTGSFIVTPAYLAEGYIP